MIRRPYDVVRGRLSLRLAGAALVVLAPALQAQSATSLDPRFQPWLGCWGMPSGGPASSVLPSPAGERTCVVPSSSVPGGVDLVALRGDSVAERTALPPTGVPTPRTVDGCTGEQLASWSVDNRHLLMRSTLACAGGVRRVETAVLGFTEGGDWLQVQHLEVDGNAATTVSRRAAEEVSDRLWRAIGGGEAPSRYAMRLALGAPLTLAQVREVATRMPAPLTEAWLAVRAPRFELTGGALKALARAGVPGRVVDMLVALDNPEVFAVGPDSQRAADNVQLIGRGGCRTRAECGWDRGAWGSGAWGGGPWGSPWGWDPWAWRYGAVGYGYGGGPWGGAWGPGWGPGWGTGYFWGSQPIVIAPRVDDVEAARAVPGRGYVRERRPGAPSGGSSGGRASDPAPVGSGGSVRSGGSSSGGASSGGGSSTGRTAKPRGGG